MTAPRFPLLSVFGLLIVACGADHHPSAQQACAHLAEAYCATLAKCDPTSLQILFGDQNGCVKSTETTCPRAFGPGSGDSPTATDACADSLGAESCSSFHVVGKLCETPPGTLKDGKACFHSGQCASGVCSTSSAAACGVCIPAAAEGESCADTGCAAGLECVSLGEAPTGLKCARLAAEGEACTNGFACAEGLYCNAKVHCAPRKKAGESCKADLSECDYAKSLYCSQAGKCEPQNVAQIGEACDREFTIACANGVCDVQTDPAHPKCVALLKEGAACTLGGTYCEIGLSCYEGKCTAEKTSCE